MKKIYDLADEQLKRATPRYAQPATARPVYLVLVAFVVIVGAASLFAWWSTEFSLVNRARRGEAKAQYLLGKQYFDHAQFPQDYVRAATLIRKAAEQEYARAETALGLLYENGIGVVRNYNLAANWLRLAASQGYPVAQNELG